MPSNTVSQGDIEYRIADGEEDASYLREQIRQLFGTGFTRDGLQPYLYEIAGREPPTRRKHLRWPRAAHGEIAQATNGGDTIDRIGGSIVTVESWAQMQPKLPSPIVDFETQVGNHNGWFVFNYVDDRYRGQGIGTELTQRRLRWLREDTDAEVAFAVAWERESGDQSAPVLQKCGFEHIGTSDFYFETMEERKRCPDCGIQPDDGDYCRCAGLIYRLEL
jgi:GNAT superfamily N-acetyltransferase